MYFLLKHISEPELSYLYLGEGVGPGFTLTIPFFTQLFILLLYDGI